MKAYSYIRFSTPDQMKGDSFRRQTEQARKYAEENGLELQDLTFKDLGVSGFKGKNLATGALGQFKEAVSQGTIPSDSYLLIEAWDRFSRMSPEDALHEMLELSRLGITIVTLMDGQVYKRGQLDTMKLLVCLMLMSRAHEESMTKSKRIKEAKRAKVEKARSDKNVIVTKHCPAWVTLQGNTFVLIESKANNIRLIMELSIAGYGKQAIAEFLNKNKVPTMNTARAWHKAYIGKVLKSTAVYGQFTPKTGEPIDDYYPAAVEEETWKLANLRMKQRNKTKAHVSKDTVGNYFSGLMICKCGSKYRKVDKRKRHQKEEGYDLGVYHICMGKEEHNGCRVKNLRLVTVDQLLFSALHQVGLSGDVDVIKKPSQVPQLELDLAEMDKKIGTALDLLLSTPSEALQTRLSELENQKKALEKLLESARLEDTEDSSKPHLDTLQDLANILRSGDDDCRRRLAHAIRQLVSHITVDDRDLHIYLRSGRCIAIVRTDHEQPTYLIDSNLVSISKEIYA